jgi:hypothetical protein
MTLPVTPMRALTLVATAVLAVALSGATMTANAGIIVTIGKPNPEPCREKDSPYTREGKKEQRTFRNEGTRCVELPDGGVECGSSIRLDSASALPRDWSCVAVGPGLLWCETPSAPMAGMGGAPAAAAGGDYDPSRYEPAPSSTPTIDPAGDEMMAVGCSGGGLSNLLPLFAALPLLALCRRRGC